MALFQACIVREEASVSEAVDQAVAEHPLAEDMFESAKWRIAREPDCGTPVTDVPQSRFVVHILPNRDAETPGLLVRYYRESVDLVVVDWVRFYPYDDRLAVRPGAYLR